MNDIFSILWRMKNDWLRVTGYKTNHQSPITNNPRCRPAYIFLISVIIVGAVITATSVTLLLLGLGAEMTGLAVHDSLQAYENAQTCTERALRSLRADLAYAGVESAALANGSCVIGAVSGAGNNDRTLCVSGQTGDTVRRFTVIVARVYPTTLVRSWAETSSFAFCGT